MLHISIKCSACSGCGKEMVRRPIRKQCHKSPARDNKNISRRRCRRLQNINSQSWPWTSSTLCCDTIFSFSLIMECYYSHLERLILILIKIDGANQLGRNLLPSDFNIQANDGLERSEVKFIFCWKLSLLISVKWKISQVNTKSCYPRPPANFYQILVRSWDFRKVNRIEFQFDLG